MFIWLSKKTLKEEPWLLKPPKGFCPLTGLTEPTLSLTNAEPCCNSLQPPHTKSTGGVQSVTQSAKLPLKQLSDFYRTLLYRTILPFQGWFLHWAPWHKEWMSSCQTCQPLMILALLSALPFPKEPWKPTVNSTCLVYSILFLISTFPPGYCKSVNEKSKATLGY